MKISPVEQFLLIVILASGVTFGFFKYSDMFEHQPASIFQNSDETLSLPDLAPLSMYDIHLSWVSGRRVLKFTSTFWNRGRKNFELVANPTTTETREVYQRIVKDDGTEQKTLVGSFVWHPAHNHYHYGDFADYIFTLVKPSREGTPAIVPSIRQKTTFCLRDNDPFDLSLPGAPQTKLFAECNSTRQGVSIGWTDVYKYDLPDQYIDVQDMPAGVYALSFLLDPNGHFTEERKDNNISTVFIELNPSAGIAKVIASAAPFTTSKNIFSDNILIKANDHEEVYVMHDNKKRWIRSEEIFNSYNFAWNSIYPLTQSMIEVIPFNNLVRPIEAEEVYALNDLGYNRHILNPEVFFSYGFTAADIANINQVELNNYQDANLIMTPGNEDVYSFTGNTKKRVGTFSSLKLSGYNLSPLHIINQIDFDAYITQP